MIHQKKCQNILGKHWGDNVKKLLFIGIFLLFLLPSAFAQFDLNSLFPEEKMDYEDCYLTALDNNTVRDVLEEKIGEGGVWSEIVTGCNENIDTHDKKINYGNVIVKQAIDSVEQTRVNFDWLIVD